MQLDNIKAAAAANKFDLIQIGWFRNEALVADRVAANEGRNAFIAWAVALLQSLGFATSVNYKQDDLLANWNALPERERQSMTRSNPASYFVLRDGIRLTMKDLLDRAFQIGGLAGGSGEDWSEYDGGGQGMSSGDGSSSILAVSSGRDRLPGAVSSSDRAAAAAASPLLISPAAAASCAAAAAPPAWRTGQLRGGRGRRGP